MGNIVAADLGKAYKHYRRRWHRLREWLTWPRREIHHQQWIFRHLNFSVAAGETVGIIGRNGAGKSTLLKLLTGTAVPTEGSIRLEGRVAALLELGMGFHPEFTGRQNIHVSGQLLGLSADEIERLLPGIEIFADIGDAIDHPVRTYSSGMQVRLAFSLATALRPDILIVDEALAVGDLLFQQKCYERMRDYVAAGTTLLFVSHDLGAVISLCDRAILLDEGCIIADGSPKDVVDIYQSRMIRIADAARRPDGLVAAVPTNTQAGKAHIAGEGAQLLDVALLVAGVPATVMTTGTAVELVVRIRLRQDLDDPHIGFRLRDRLGNTLHETNTYCHRQMIGLANIGDIVVARFLFALPLTAGHYSIGASLGNRGNGKWSIEETILFLPDVISFEVTASPHPPYWAGTIDLQTSVTSKLEAQTESVFPLDIPAAQRQRLSGPGDIPRPVMLVCETVNRCTLDCVFCAYGEMQRPRETMSLPLFEKLLSDYADIGGGYLSLTPVVGEVFTDRHLLERIRLTRQQPAVQGVSITTNAVGLRQHDDAALAEILAGLHRIHISIYGMDAEEHQAITRKDTFATFLEGLRRIADLIDDRAKLWVNFRLFKAREPAEFETWLQQHVGYQPRHFHTLEYAHWSGTSQAATIALPQDAKWSMRPQVESFCIIPAIAAQVHANGNVSICHCDDYECEPALSLGNLAEQSLRTLFASQKYRDFWRLRGSHMPDFCRRCGFYQPYREGSRLAAAIDAPLDFIGG